LLGLLASLGLSVASLGCEVVHGNGVVREEERVVPPFSRAKIQANIITEAIPAGEPAVRLSADENLLGHLSVRVVDGELVIAVDDENMVLEPSQPMTAIVSSAELRTLQVSGGAEGHIEGFSGDAFTLIADGPGDLRADNLDVDVLRIEIGGDGALNASGIANRVELKHSGAGEASTEAVTARDVVVDLSGGGDNEVTATETVRGSLSGAGDLTVHGDPELIDVNDSGDGAVSIRR
jgi:hypothetical protein